MFKLSELLSFLYEHGWISERPVIARDITINRFASLAHPSSDALCWSKKQLSVDRIPNCGVLICLPNQETESCCGTLIVRVADPRNVFREIVSHFNPETPNVGVAANAIVHPTTVIGKDVYIGPGCIIEENCKIGDNTVIDANVVLYKNVTVGKNCHIFSGAIIGPDGFGYTKDDDGHHQKICHIGGVTIGNNVDIGANSCIERGVLDDTTIGDGTKIGNKAHVGHNDIIGQNCRITVGTCFGGSCMVGNDVWFGMNSTISNGIRIGDNADIKLGAVVINNVKAGEIVSGNFAIRHEKHLVADAKDKMVKVK